MSEFLVTVRVSKSTKERMKRAGVNWSEELRRVIEERLASEDRKKATDELDRLLAVVKPGFDSALTIKETRRCG